MMVRWQSVQLRQLISRVKREISVEDNEIYTRLTIRMNGRGIAKRDVIQGIEIGTKKQFIARTGQLILSKIDARNGAFGLLADDCDMAIITGNFWAFDVDHTRMLPGFFEWLTKTRTFVDFCIRASSGTTNRLYLQEEIFLDQEIQLPSLAEQQRIVALIEVAAAKIREAQKLRWESAHERGALCRAILAADPEINLIPMAELVTLRVPDVTVRPDETYQFAGVYSFGRGVFRGQAKSGLEFAYPKLTTLRAGNFTYPKLMAWEGALGVVPKECDECVVSTEFPVFEIDEARVLPEVLDVHFRNPAVWPQLSGSSTGTNVRRRRLNPRDFLEYQMPVPSRRTQMRLRSVMNELSRLTLIDHQVNVELDALLPAILDKAFHGELL